MAKQKIFTDFPTNKICPLCKTNDNTECCLITIDGTTKGNISEAQPMHIECINQFSKLRYNKEVGVLYRNLQEG
jgi:predicted proteasome-type protease